MGGLIRSVTASPDAASLATAMRILFSSSSPGVHALSSIGTNLTYCYDAKGNQTHAYENGVQERFVEYSGYDKPVSIVSTKGQTDFSYDAAHARFKRIDTTDDGSRTTYYLGNVELISHNSGLKEYKRYIGESTIDTLLTNNTRDTVYLHKDHLGSINFISDSNGDLLHKLSFDAFGKRRDGATWSAIQDLNASTSIQSILNITQDGFTGHEHVDHANIIHMGGRIYDPTLGRFVQADPIV